MSRENGQRVSYNPHRLHGVTLYRETERAFAKGDRVQFTAPKREEHIANRELGTIEQIDTRGNLQVRLDSGRMVAFNIRENRHIDHGYAVTSYSSQGQTADRVLIHVDTERGGEKLTSVRDGSKSLSTSHSAIALRVQYLRSPGGGATSCGPLE